MAGGAAEGIRRRQAYGGQEIMQGIHLRRGYGGQEIINR